MWKWWLTYVVALIVGGLITNLSNGERKIVRLKIDGNANGIEVVIQRANDKNKRPIFILNNIKRNSG